MIFYYMLQWTDGTGGSYTRSFNSYEERAAFIPRISRRDWRGMLNYTVWERTAQDTIPYREEV